MPIIRASGAARLSMIAKLPAPPPDVEDRFSILRSQRPQQGAAPGPLPRQQADRQVLEAPGDPADRVPV